MILVDPAEEGRAELGCRLTGPSDPDLEDPDPDENHRRWREQRKAAEEALAFQQVKELALWGKQQPITYCDRWQIRMQGKF